MSPLKLLMPRSGHSFAHVVISNYGGGFVGDDRVEIALEVQPAATLLVTTQSSTKVYRNRGCCSGQHIAAAVDEHATLLVLPDPLCCYAESTFRQSQKYDLSSTGNLVLLDWMTSGRAANGERWAFNEYVSHTLISVEDELAVRESLRLGGSVQPPGDGFALGAFNCYAMLFIIGPRLEAARTELVDRCAELGCSAGDHTLLSATKVTAGTPAGLIVRLAGRTMGGVRQYVRELLHSVRGLIGADPWDRKW